MINIKIYNLNLNNYNVFINNKCINTNSNSICIRVDPGVYRISVLNQTQVVLYNGCNLTIPFYFNCQNNIRVIRLTDRYYEGLKIEKGEIIFNEI